MLRKIEPCRPFLLFAAFYVLFVQGHILLAMVVGFGAFFATFILLHDAMHGALSLPRRLNEALISVTGFMLLKSGHCLRASHLRHHQAPCAADDPEAAVARWPLWRVVAIAPAHIVALHFRGLTLQPRTARLQIAETLAVHATLALVVCAKAPALLAYAGICFVGTVTMPLWAAYIPHTWGDAHPVMRIAKCLAGKWTPVLATLAFHEVHHRHPKVRTLDLATFARDVT